MTSLEAALRYPTEHDDWVKTILIGGVLALFSFLLVPIFLVSGYLVRVLRHRLAGDPEPPTFGDWEELFVDGVRAFAVSLAYMLVPVVVGTVTVGGSIVALATGTRGGAAIGLGGLALGFLLTLALTLVLGYVAVAALVNFVHEDRLAAAFDFGTLRGIVTHRDYAVAWLLSVVLFVGASVVTGVLNVVPFIGAIAAAFVLFYVQIAAASLWADGFSDALEPSDDTPQSTAGDPAV